MISQLVRWNLYLAAVTAVVPSAATAQSLRNVHSLADAVLLLHKDVNGDQQHVLDQLFSGKVDATILDRDLNKTNFEDGDIIALGLTPASGRGQSLIFTGTRTAFDAWVDANSQGIMDILFPNSVTESASGIDAAQAHSQAFLLSTALAMGARGNIGGRIEFEGFDVQDESGNAFQGLFKAKAFAVEGRYAWLDNSIQTRSGTFGVDLHPSWGLKGSSTEWRIGGDGYFSAMWSRSSALDVGSMDYGGGGWASGRKDFARTSVSFGGIFLGSNTYIPSAAIDDSLQFFADVVNAREIRWDLTYGGAVRYLAAPKVSLGTQFLQIRSIKSPLDEGRTSQSILFTIAYLVGSDSPVDVGYRFSGGGDRYRASAIFMNANFTF